MEKKNKGQFSDRIDAAESRVLYVLIKRCCGNFTNFVKQFGISRQYCAEIVKKGIPLPYASYLARLNNIHPALLNYKIYVMMGGVNSFEVLVNNAEFTDEELAYILAGDYIRNPQKFLKEFDREFLEK